MSEPSADETERGWNFGTPDVVSRASALLKGLFGGGEHEIRSTIGASPKRDSPPREGFYGTFELYKVWYVLHREQFGDDRTTNLYIRKIGTGQARVEDVFEASIRVSLLPLDHHEWLSQEESDTSDTDTAREDGGRDA